MIVFKCDLCKNEIEKRQHLILMLKKPMNEASGPLDKIVTWDICTNCQDAVAANLGEGRYQYANSPGYMQTGAQTNQRKHNLERGQSESKL